VADEQPLKIPKNFKQGLYNPILYGMDLAFRIKHLTLWKPPVPASSVVGNLSFIKSDAWGMALAMAFRKIEKKDFELILSMVKKDV